MVSMQTTTRAFGDAKGPGEKMPRVCKHRPKRFWLKVLEEFEGCSLSMKNFCAERGLSVSTFHSWRRRLHPAMTSPQKFPATASKPQPHFLPVYVTSPEAPPEKQMQPDQPLRQQLLSKKCAENFHDIFSESTSGLSLHLNESLRISVDQNFHEPTLQRLVHIFSPKESATC